MRANDSVFSGRKEFSSTTRAYQEAFREIHRLMRQDIDRGDPVEYGFEIEPSGRGMVRLGHLIRGDERSVASGRSSNPWGFLAPPRIGSWGGSADMPSGHSHPRNNPMTMNCASSADVLGMLQSRPLGGKLMHAIYDHKTGLGYKFEFDKNVRIPPALLRQDGPQTAQEIKDSAHWLRQQLNNGTLNVTLIVAAGSGSFVPSFGMAVGPRDDSQSRSVVIDLPPRSIRIAPDLLRFPYMY